MTKSPTSNLQTTTILHSTQK